MKRILLTLAIFTASTAYGCVARAQCPNGNCPVQQPQPVRQVVYATAQAVTQAVQPTGVQKGLCERIAERRAARKEQRQRCR